MFVCVCLCVCVHMCVCVCVDDFMHTRVCMHACEYAYVYLDVSDLDPTVCVCSGTHLWEAFPSWVRF